MNLRMFIYPGSGANRLLATICRVARLLTLCYLCGCHLQEQPASLRAPAVTTRFTSNPLPTAGGCPPQMQAMAGLPNLKVGLAMQSFNDPVHMPFASNLGVAIIRELQLSGASMQVQPVTMDLQPVFAGESREASPANVISVSFQEPLDVLPPDQPPLPPGTVSGRAAVDQILVVRIMEYRPYFPMRASLEIKVLQGESEELLYMTTASWNAADFGLVEPKPKRKKHYRWFGEAQPGDPSPGHNSPDALMSEIATDITMWYTTALNPVLPQPPKTKRRLLR
jgi:hypothetical protein